MAIDTYWNISWNTGVTDTDTEVRQREEAQWIEASRGGDRAAFEALVKRYERRVFRLAGRFFRRPEEVEDVAQETFLTIWRKLDTYRARAPFEHWLTRVCLNCCYARFRKRRPEDTGVPDLEVAVSGDDPGPRLDAERLLAMLEPEDRFVLQLLHGEGWSTAEIAEKLGWSRSKVKSEGSSSPTQASEIAERRDLKMNCREFQKRLIAETKVRVTGLDEVERHRSRCPECARFASEFESVRELLGRPANRDIAPSAAFSSRVVASLPEPQSPLAWAAIRLLPATTALALTLLGWCWLATPSPGELWTQAGADEVLSWVLSDNAYSD